ncbi:MAG: ankyrin repeat domain-containing protein [Gammaproteobacteria bacterium]
MLLTGILAVASWDAVAAAQASDPLPRRIRPAQPAAVDQAEIPALMQRLNAALAAGDMTELAAVLDALPTVATAKGKGGRTWLHSVASKGNVDAARVFLEHGADVNAVDDEGAPALVLAVLKNHTAMVRFLLDSGADPTIQLTIEGSPTVESFVKRGEQPEIRTAIKQAKLRRSDSMSAWVQAIGRSDAPEMKRILAAHPEYGSSPYPGGGWPLYQAVAAGGHEAVELLLDAGAPIDAKEENGGTALMLSVIAENAELVNLLIDRGAELGHALTVAAGECKLDMLTLLIERGVNVNYLDQGTTALDHAQLMGHDVCMKLLKKHGAKRGKDL